MKITNKLNNIFDQYSVDENRITNAFLQTLVTSPELLADFLKKRFNIKLKKNSSVVVSSQKEPYELGDSDKDQKKVDSIPDGWIIVDEKKAIVFEAKVKKGAIRRDQLLSHVKRIRSYDDRYLCVITPDDESPIGNIEIEGTHTKWFSWRTIYEWINDNIDKKSNVAHYLGQQLKEFLAMKEDLVGFQGISFTSGEFNSEEAKGVIKNLIKEIKPDILKKYPQLKFERKSYSQDVHAYTVFHRSTWSFLGAHENFTKDMHLTFWLAETHMGMGITIPNNAGKRWKRLKAICKKEDLFDLFVKKLFELRKHVPNLYLEFVHRHYLRQRDGIIDGILEMDIDTLKGSKKVKANELWLAALKELVGHKKGYNGQFMIRTRFFYKDHPKIKTAAFKDTVIKVAYEFKDIYDYLTRSNK